MEGNEFLFLKDGCSAPYHLQNATPQIERKVRKRLISFLFIPVAL